MPKIELYMDEAKGDHKSFRISVPIWGTPANCLAYKEEIKKIVDSHPKLGANFKEFHSIKLNEKNWDTTGKIYIEVLNKFIEFVCNGRLKFFIRLEADGVYERNAGYLKEIAKKNMQNRASELGQIFTSLQDADLPAFYHRIDQLIVFLKYRDKFGQPGDEFDFYPDSEGKLLRYGDIAITVNGDIFKNFPLKFYDAIKVWGNSLAKVIPELLPGKGWPEIEQHLNSFCPLNSTDDYIIQTCDIIANFFYGYIYYIAGHADKKYRLKAEAIEQLLDLNKYKIIIKDAFTLEAKGEVSCSNPNLKAIIEFKIP